MLCPYCNYDSSKVLESRTAGEKTSIRRRRECESCGQRFTTYERVESGPLLVVKKNGSREDYSRMKLFTSIKNACHKCELTVEQLEGVVESIEQEINNNGKREVSSAYLGKLVLERLKELEKVAYVRYSSVYNQFRSVNEFVEEVKNLS